MLIIRLSFSYCKSIFLKHLVRERSKLNMEKNDTDKEGVEDTKEEKEEGKEEERERNREREREKERERERQRERLVYLSLTCCCSSAIVLSESKSPACSSL